ncbi:hypothetical protein PanWU01x14_131690 [Parasponia andersonii]|uniref:Uncharacterized protein n=1 Tax=Parasponia andersonii TaxID=3476 RepID=A0A2P5CR38_PARAD|nr:hypothetical protein PanWU01x14_131690 [Parasponia andersonii]
MAMVPSLSAMIFGRESLEEEAKKKKSGKFGYIQGTAVPLLEHRGAVSETDWHRGTVVLLPCNEYASNKHCGACFMAPLHPRPIILVFLCSFLTSFDALAVIGLYRTNPKRDLEDFSASKVQH